MIQPAWPRQALPYLLALALAWLIFWPAFDQASRKSNDVEKHLVFAQRMKTEGFLPNVLHFFYHLLVIAADETLPSAPPMTLALLPMLLANALLALGLLHLLKDAGANGTLALGLTLLLLIFAPIMLGTLDGGLLALGYLHPTVYHNPTQQLLRLFALPLSLFALRALQPRPHASAAQRWGLALLCAVLVILLSLSKPNYTLALLPTLGLMGAYRLWKRQPLDWPLLLSLVVPALAMLGMQFISTFGVTDDHVTLSWLGFYSTRGLSAADVLLMLLLSAAFPLAVLALHGRQAWADPYLRLSWISFAFGAAFAYFVHEGKRMTDGNFVWGGYVTLFLLICASVVFILRTYQVYFAALRWHSLRAWWQGAPPRLKIILLVFGAHAVSSIRYYLLWLT
ncbi:MAG: hypothetical protein RML73_01235 [Anaerolineae bacterium]|nr:hypothetical protein [Anaerolineae bacterium]